MGPENDRETNDFSGLTLEELNDLRDQNRKRHSEYQALLSSQKLSKQERRAVEAAKAANQHAYDELTKARAAVKRNHYERGR